MIGFKQIEFLYHTGRNSTGGRHGFCLRAAQRTPPRVLVQRDAGSLLDSCRVRAPGGGSAGDDTMKALS